MYICCFWYKISNVNKQSMSIFYLRSCHLGASHANALQLCDLYVVSCPRAHRDSTMFNCVRACGVGENSSAVQSRCRPAIGGQRRTPKTPARCLLRAPTNNCTLTRSSLSHTQIGADGANSLVRRHIGADHYAEPYAQMGLIATVRLRQPDATNHTAWQRFLPDGSVLAVLPLSAELSSIVWSTTAARVRQLLALDAVAFVEQLNEQLVRLEGLCFLIILLSKLLYSSYRPLGRTVHGVPAQRADRGRRACRRSAVRRARDGGDNAECATATAGDGRTVRTIAGRFSAGLRAHGHVRGAWDRIDWVSKLAVRSCYICYIYIGPCRILVETA